MQGGDTFKRKTPIKKRTSKRAKDERYYAIRAKEFFNDAVKNGTNLCVFCGKKVTNFEGLHHAKGRKNDALLDEMFWFTVHNDCHLMYHYADVGKLMKEPWYADFMLRLLAKSPELHRLEIKKQEKSHPTIDFDEE